MKDKKSMEIFSKTPVMQAVFKNALPAMAAMLMVLVYNLADTFFIGQTHDALQVAAVSLATPVFLIFMAAGTIFGVGGTSVISRALGEGNEYHAKKVCAFCMWSCIIAGTVMAVLFLIFMDPILSLIGASPDTWDLAKTYLTIVAYQDIPQIEQSPICGPRLIIICFNQYFRAWDNMPILFYTAGHMALL